MTKLHCRIYYSLPLVLSAATEGVKRMKVRVDLEAVVKAYVESLIRTVSDSRERQATVEFDQSLDPKLVEAIRRQLRMVEGFGDCQSRATIDGTSFEVQTLQAPSGVVTIRAWRVKNYWGDGPFVCGDFSA